MRKAHNKLDLKGQKFGKLEVLQEGEPKKMKNGHLIMWVCKCDCGNEKTISTGHLRSGHTISCGCIGKEKIKLLNKSHGMTQTRTYRIYNAMITRCYNPNFKYYEYYGGRGIKVCDRWLESFENFLIDVGLCPSNDHSLDRFPNKDGNYEPGNIRWANRFEQMNNTRKNKYFVFEGQKLSISELSRKTGIPIPSIVNWIHKYNMSDDEIIKKVTERCQSEVIP